MNHDKSIIWAVDAFAEKDLQVRGLKILSALSESLNLEIDPVYVLSSSQVQIQNDFYPTWAIDYEKASGNLLDDLVKLGHFLKVKKPTVLTTTTDSLRGTTDELIKHAKKTHAKAIFVNSHANEGLPRFFLGSFTETLLLQSKIPIIITNPTTSSPSKIKNIMLPTNFSHGMRQGLEDAVYLAKKLKAELTLYNKEITPLYLTFPEAPFYNIYMDDIAKQLRKNAQEWMEWSKNQGVHCKLALDNSKEMGVVGKHIVKYAEENSIDLICLISQSSALEAAILGSTARYVVRHAHCPIWVHHS